MPSSDILMVQLAADEASAQNCMQCAAGGGTAYMVEGVVSPRVAAVKRSVSSGFLWTHMRSSQSMAHLDA